MEKDRVFFWGIICFITGVGIGACYVLPFPFLWYLAIALWGAIFCVFPRREIFLVSVGVLVFLGGAQLALREKTTFDQLFIPVTATSGVARVINNPEEKSFFQKVILRFESCTTETCPKKDVLWQAPRTEGIQAGDLVRITCQLERPENFSADFDYRMFLAKDGIGFLCQHASTVHTLEPDAWGRAMAAVYTLKHALERALSGSIAEPEAGLAKGLLLGGDDYLPDSLKEAFRRVGLTHMVAVSGYNITLIAQGLLVVGLFSGLWRKHALWGAFFGIVFFILMIGAPASATRAGLMAGVAFAALQAGRLSRPVNALLLAAGLMLLFQPLILLYDLGFQLSFLATLGIIIFSSYQERLLPRPFFGRSLIEIMLMTVAVELFVLPIILFSFHFFSPLIIIGNFLIIIVPVAMALAFLTGVLFLVLPGAHVVFSWLAFGLLSAITRSVEWLGSLPHTSVAVEQFGLKSLIAWYLMLFFLVRFAERYYAQKSYDYEA